MLSYLREAKLPHIIVATKIDKLNTTERNAFIKSITTDPDASGAGCIVLYSSQNNQGRDDLWEEILNYARLETKSSSESST